MKDDVAEILSLVLEDEILIPLQEDTEAGGHWITVNGNHILLGKDQWNADDKSPLHSASNADSIKSSLESSKNFNAKLTLIGSVATKGKSEHDIDFLVKPGKNFNLQNFHDTLATKGFIFAGNSWDLKQAWGAGRGEKDDLINYIHSKSGAHVDFFFPAGALHPNKEGTLDADITKEQAAQMAKLCEDLGGGHWVTINGAHVFIGTDGQHHALVATGIYRANNVSSVGEVPALFHDPKTLAFEKEIPVIAKQYDGVNITGIERSAGVWQSSREASFLIQGETDNPVALDAFAAKLGTSAPEQQMAMARFIVDSHGKDFAYELTGVKNEEHAVSTLLKHGFEGMTAPLDSGRIVLLDTGGGSRANVKMAAKELGLHYTETPGSVRFIEEKEYGEVQNEYRRSKGQTQEVLRRDVPHLQEETCHDTLVQLIKLLEGWVTINGAHILIGGDGQSNLYHGTSADKLASIMKSGLKSGHAISPHGSDGIFATSDKGTAKDYGMQRAAPIGSSPAKLDKAEVGIVVLDKKAANFLPADESPKTFIATNKTISPDHIKRIEVYKYRDIEKHGKSAKPVRVIQHTKEAADDGDEQDDELYIILAPDLMESSITEDIHWVTINGNHIPLGGGGKEGAFDRSGPVSTDSTAYLFHGTSSARIKDIIVNGLKQPNQANWASSDRGYVYAGTNSSVAENYALLATGHMQMSDGSGFQRQAPAAGGEPIELVLKVPKAEFKEWHSDPKSLGLMHFGTITPDHIVGVIKIPHGDKPIIVKRDRATGGLLQPNVASLAKSTVIPIKDYMASLAEQQEPGGDDFVTLYAPYAGSDKDLKRFMGPAYVPGENTPKN